MVDSFRDTRSTPAFPRHLPECFGQGRAAGCEARSPVARGFATRDLTPLQPAAREHGPRWQECSGQYRLAHGCWRECEGVEPSADGEGSLPADLKSVKPTGTHPLPRFGHTRGGYRNISVFAARNGPVTGPRGALIASAQSPRVEPPVSESRRLTR